VIDVARRAGACDAVVASHFEHGGKGAVALAEAVVRACTASLARKRRKVEKVAVFRLHFIL